jgi:hypothetical protein
MQMILEKRNLSCEIQIPVACSAVDALKLLDHIIEAARVVYMDEVFQPCHSFCLALDFIHLYFLTRRAVQFFSARTLFCRR